MAWGVGLGVFQDYEDLGAWVVRISERLDCVRKIPWCRLG